LSIERRLYIFAACEQYAVDPVEYRVDCLLSSKRRHNDWYEACTFKCSDVCVVESYPMWTVLKI
jgi:hypothetical protein